jgi:hypothetical protein
MEVFPHVMIPVAVVPLNVTTLSLWVEPNPSPVIVTVEPTDPAVGEIPVMESGSMTVNVTPLLV